MPANGIDLTEIVIGFDGIVLANAKSGPQLRLTRQQIYLATAKMVPDPKKPCQSNWCEPIANPYKKWNQIDPSLPDAKIEILGLPANLGHARCVSRIGHVKRRQCFSAY